MSVRNAETSGFVDSTEQPNVGDSQEQDSFSVIDRHSIFDGVFQSNRDLRIEGEVKGTIECKGTLFVAQGANVSAKVEAENISVAGDLNGDVRCRGRLQIMPSGRVRGKVNTMTLVINEGAYYEGQLEMTPPDDRIPVAPPRQLQSVTQPVSISSAATQRTVTPESGASSTFIRRLGGPETPWDTRGGTDPADEGDEG